MKICESFYGLQGECIFAGHPMIMIRTTGCVKPYCDFCDTKYSWKEGIDYPLDLLVKNIVKLSETNGCKFIVITGGEPFIQKDIYELIEILQKKGFKIQIETSGKVDFKTLTCDVVCSPKQYSSKFSFKVKKWNEKITYYKFVLSNHNHCLSNVWDFIRKHKIDKDKVYFMPLTTYDDVQDLIIKQYVWKACCKYNIKYSARLHVDVFGKKRRV
jgi:7-carboxy-7-deazaguanine synthase